MHARWVVAMVSLCAQLPGCAPDDSQRRRDIDQYIRSIELLPFSPSERFESEPGAAFSSGDFSCSEKSVHETREFDRIVAYAANSEALWPGAILGGRSVESGLLAQRVFSRAPMSFSVSLENLSGAKSAIVENPQLSTFRDALGQILDAELTGATPANIYAELEEVHSEQQLQLALGARAGWMLSPVKFNASFDFENQQMRSRYLVTYTQAYYTVDVDPWDRPSSVFADDVDVDAVREQVEADDPPTYVSSITYGRMIVFAIESEFARTELEAALDFVYRGGLPVGGDVAVSHEQILNRSKITAFILGGSGEQAAQSIDSYDALINFIKDGGNYSKDSPGSPIAYRLSYLADNSPARMSLTLEYSVEDCVRVNQKVKVSLDSIFVEEAGDDGQELEVFGTIWSGGSTGSKTLFSRTPSLAVTIDEGTSWPESGIINEAVVDVIPEPGQLVELGANLTEYDEGLFGNDDFLGEQVFDATFEAGWRRSVVLHFANNGGAKLQVRMSIEPI